MEQAHKEEKPQAQKMTRQQIREVTRIKQDAEKLHGALCTKFINFFLNNDPESVEVRDKHKEVSAKWRQYCHLNHINPGLHDSVDKFCIDYIKDYREKRGPYIEIDHQQEALRIQKAKLELEKSYEIIFAQLSKIPYWVRRIFNAI